MAVEARTFLSTMLAPLLGCLLLAAAPAPQQLPGAEDQPPQASDQAPGGLFCTDDMETEPFNDDYEAVPVANHDAACQAPQEPVPA